MKQNPRKVDPRKVFVKRVEQALQDEAANQLLTECVEIARGQILKAEPNTVAWDWFDAECHPQHNRFIWLEHIQSMQEDGLGRDYILQHLPQRMVDKYAEQRDKEI